MQPQQEDMAMETDHQHGFGELKTEPASRWVGSLSSNTANCLIIYLMSNIVPLDWGTNFSTGQSHNVSVISKKSSGPFNWEIAAWVSLCLTYIHSVQLRTPSLSTSSDSTPDKAARESRHLLDDSFMGAVVLTQENTTGEFRGVVLIQSIQQGHV